MEEPILSKRSSLNPKTPQFDAALDAYFAGLVFDEKGGQWRICRFSGERFYVRSEDIVFYKKIRVSLPTLSPSERARRRMAFSPGYNFFQVKSAVTEKSIISVYPPTTPFKIYEHQFWFSDQWDPLSYGRDVDTKKLFFEEFLHLGKDVPRPNLNTDSSNINSDYTNNSIFLKNSYMTYDSLYGEDLYYCESALKSKNCMDCWLAMHSDTCYRSRGDRMFKCIFCQEVNNCFESYFLFDCKNCEYCFMCSNLRNKKYYFYNQPLTKEEYEKRLKEINLGNFNTLQKYLGDYKELKKNAIRRDVLKEHAINSVGNWMYNVKDCYWVYFIYESEQVCYSIGLWGYRDSYDASGGTNAELCYEFMTISSENNYGIKFSNFINNSRNLEYCDSCHNCRDCFGCIGLRNKAFCILNKQYTEDEYWRKIDEIKTAMFTRGEYGEFFPPELAPFPYNISLVTAYPGYDNFDEARRYGYSIEEIPEASERGITIEVIRSGELPLDVKEADDSILDKVVLDEVHNKKFRITKFELAFYRKHNLPLPRMHPILRMHQWRNDFDLRLRFFERPCARCGKMMQTSYAPDRPEKNIYCEGCYYEVIG